MDEMNELIKEIRSIAVNSLPTSKREPSSKRQSAGVARLELAWAAMQARRDRMSVEEGVDETRTRQDARGQPFVAATAASLASSTSGPGEERMQHEESTTAVELAQAEEDDEMEVKKMTQLCHVTDAAIKALTDGQFDKLDTYINDLERLSVERLGEQECQKKQEEDTEEQKQEEEEEEEEEEEDKGLGTLINYLEKLTDTEHRWLSVTEEMREEYTTMKNEVQDKTSIVKQLVEIIKNAQKKVEALQDKEIGFEEIIKNVVHSNDLLDKLAEAKQQADCKEKENEELRMQVAELKEYIAESHAEQVTPEDDKVTNS